MRRHVLPVSMWVILAAGACIAFAQAPATGRCDDQADLPREASDAIKAADEDIAGIRAEAEKKVENRKGELVARLKKLENDLTKAGKLDEAVAVREAVRKLTDAFPAGSHVDVEWRGTWYEAQVIESKDGQWHIKYDGYGEEWNEWVDAKRIRARTKPAPGAEAIELEIVPVDE